MKKKRNTKFQGKDLLVVSLCVAGILFSLYAYYRDTNISLLKQDEAPVAVVTYKFKSVQRRFENRVFWDRVRQESPLYNGDIIRTAPDSEANITLQSGTALVMSEKTLIQIFVDKDGEKLTFETGNINLTAKNKLSLQSGSNVVKLEKGTSLNATAKQPAAVKQPEREAKGKDGTGADETGTFTLLMLSGSAAVENAGETSSLARGEVFAATMEGQPAAKPLLTVIEPGVSTRAAAAADGTALIPFEVRRVDGAAAEKVSVAIYADKNAASPVFTLDATDFSADRAQIALPSGVFYWRAFLENETGAPPDVAAAGTISVVPPEKQREKDIPPELPVSLARAENEIVAAAPLQIPQDVFVPVRSAASGAEEGLAASQLPAPLSGVFPLPVPSGQPESPLPETPASAKPPEAPKKAAAAVAVQPARKTQPKKKAPAPIPPPSAIAGAVTEKAMPPVKPEPPPLSAPQNLRPAADAVFAAEQLASGRLVFTWREVEDASGYVFSLYNEQNEKLLEKQSETTAFTLTDLSLLDRGAFTWRVSALSPAAAGEKRRTALAAESSFRVELAPIQLNVVKPDPAVYNEIPGNMTFIDPENIVYGQTGDVKYVQEAPPVYAQEQNPVYAGEEKPVYAAESDTRFMSEENIKYGDDQKIEFTNKETEYVR